MYGYEIITTKLKPAQSINYYKSNKHDNKTSKKC